MHIYTIKYGTAIVFFNPGLWKYQDKLKISLYLSLDNSMPIHVLQYVIHAQKRSCTHLSFGTYVQKRRVIFVHA